MMKKAAAIVLGLALVFASLQAWAAITGTNSTMQAEQARMGQLQMGMGTSTGTNTPTINNGAGIITTAALSNAAGASVSITLTNNRIAAGDMVFGSIDSNGSTGQPIIANIQVSAGQAIFVIQNIHASVALNAAVKISFLINKAGNLN